MIKRKKTVALLLILAMIFSIGLSGCGGGSGEGSGSGEAEGDSASGGEVYKMKIVNLAAESDPLNVSYRYLKEQLEKATDGRIAVEIYANKAISNSDEEQSEMIRSNMAQMTTTPSFTLAAMNSDLKNFYIFDIPYLFQTDEDIWAYGDSDVGKQMIADLLEKTGGIKAYGPFSIGWVKVSSNKQPIKSPADLKGLKIRTTSSEFYIGTMQAFGANPTPVAYGEVYTALQQGTVDGMMTSTSLYASDRFYEVQKYMGAINPFAITHYPIISNDWYESLPDDLKTIFDDCMAEYVDYVRNLELEAEAAAIQTVRDNGMEVEEYTDEQKQPFIDAAKVLWEEKAPLVGGYEVIQEASDFLDEFRASK